MSYVVGILLGVFFTGIAVSSDQAQNYDRELRRIDTQSLYHAEDHMQKAYARYYNVKGWFSCNADCQMLKGKYAKAEHEFNQLKETADLQLSDAKSKLGIFSEYGVEETRDLFWTRFNQGGQFAKRQTMWDALFAGMSAMGRDEGLVSFGIRIVLNMCINITLGLFGAMVGFAWTLWSVVSSFQPTLAEAVLFFGLAVMAALSFCATFLIGVYGVAAGTVYVTVKAAANRRIGGGRPQGRVPYREPRARYGFPQRPRHYD